MTQYIGISMVAIVITLCIGIMSNIVTENIFKQMEKHRNRMADRRWAEVGKFVCQIRENFKDEMDKILEKTNINGAKKVMARYDEIIDKFHKEGVKVEDIDLGDK